MSLIQEIDYGTPRSKSETMVTLSIDGQSVTVPEGTSIMRAAMEIGTADPKALRHRHDGCVRLLPALPRRGGRPRGHAGLLHHAGGRGDRRSHPDRAAEATAQGRDGALHLRPSAGLPDLLGQWRLRIAGHGRRGGPARRALRPERRAASQPRHRCLEPVLHLRSVEMHRLLALRPRLRGRAGHLCADHRRPRVRLGGVGGDAGVVPRARNASPAAPACRPARPRR